MLKSSSLYFYSLNLGTFRLKIEMAAITKNRNFLKWPKLLYFKPESAQI
jgi:hypothetical protein